MSSNEITARTFGGYISVYDFKRAVEDKAKQLVEIIDDLLNDEEKILSFVKSNADDIEWD